MIRIPNENKTVCFTTDNWHETIGSEKQVRDHDIITGYTTPETWQFMSERYVVLRNFIPKEIINFALDSWKVLETSSEYSDLDYHRVELSPTDGAEGITESSFRKSYSSHSAPHSVSLNRYMKNRLSEVLTIPLLETYAFSRKYLRGAMLGAHTDRPSCEISCTFPLAYATDDRKPWKIWVNNERNWVGVDQKEQYASSAAIPPAQRKNCRSVSLEVGDVLLYQGPNIVHWRDTLQGDFSYHVFCHYVAGQGVLKNVAWDALGDQSLAAQKAMLHELDPVIDITGPNKYVLHPFKYDGRPDRYSAGDQRTQWYGIANEVYNKLSFDELQNTCNNYGKNLRRVEK